LRNDPLGAWPTAVGTMDPSGLQTEFGEVLAPVSIAELEELKRMYASLIIQLDRLRPKLAAVHALTCANEGGWSVHEILGHLIDTDRDIWWPRIAAILRQDHPLFSYVDQNKLVHEQDWQSFPIDDLFAQLARTRWDFAMKLNEIPEPDFEKTGMHPTLGELSILRILQLLVAHDAHYLNRIHAMTEHPQDAVPV
jgi:hypothetical protein